MACILTNRDIGGIVVDVVISETATEGMEVPEHPVEKGAKISDHAWRKPTTLKMEIAAGDVMGTYEALFSLMKQAEPFDIVSGFAIHQNMLATGIEATRDAEHGRILKASVDLKEVIIVASQDGPATQGKAGGTGGAEKGKSAAKRGQVAAKDASSARTPKTAGGGGESILASMESM